MKVDDLLDTKEIADLAQAYGPFPRRHQRLAVGEAHLDFWEEKVLRDRRGEVVPVIQRTAQEVLLHTKTIYPKGVYRLPSGGISWGEAVSEALPREVYEETGFVAQNERLLGIESYEFYNNERTVPFVSYVFLVPNVHGLPVVQDASERIAHFCWLPVAGLPLVATTLRTLPEDSPGRQDWGRFRALVHDFVAQIMSLMRP